MSDVQDMHLASFCEDTQEQNRILCHTSARTRAHTQMYAVNASLNCISPPKCASIHPEGRNTGQDEDRRVSVAVQLISEIRWRPFGEMRTESEGWREEQRESQSNPT